VQVGRAIARSNLFKCAVFGRDPNWGRVLAAIGTTNADFEPEGIDVAFNGVQVCRNGSIGDPRELVDLSGDDVQLEVDLRTASTPPRVDQRSHLRLCQRERGVLDVTVQHNAEQSQARTLSLVEKASILTETLPWLETYAGKIVVIKYGGNAMIDADLKRAFAQDIVFMKRCGIHPVVVHGGGPQISTMLSRLGITSEFVGGLRVTSPEAMEVVRMVLVGQVGRDLVGLINTHSTLAVGLSGEDGGLFTAERRGTVVDGEEIDLGLVGDVISVRTEAVEGLIESGSVPVVASIAPDTSGVVHNVNADSAAAALAVALKAERLVVLTDVEGLYRDWPNSREVITELSATELRGLMPTLESGMVPKMEACLRAVEGGLTRATVADGRVPHALLLEIFTNVGIGTMVTQDGLIRLGSRVFSREQGIPPHERANGEFGAVPLTIGADSIRPRQGGRP
jgi:acetylglutamate kinase